MMATLPNSVPYAVAQGVASSDANNRIIDNQKYLATTLNTAEGTINTLTTRADSAAALLNNHTGRLDADHNRLTTLENRTTNTSTGNTALGNRVTDLESRPSGGDGTGFTEHGRWSQSGTPSIGQNARVPYNTVESAPVGCSMDTATGVITVTYAGRYNISACVHCNLPGSGNVWGWIGAGNNSETPRYGMTVVGGTSGSFGISCSAMDVALPAGGTVAMYLYSYAGSPLPLTTPSRKATNIAVQRIG